MNYKQQFFFRGPDFDFDFAITDALKINSYSYRILIFKIDSVFSYVATTETLKIALQKVVEKCPPLGSVIVENHTGEQPGWKKALPGPGIKLVVRDLRRELDYRHLEANDFPPQALKSEDLVPISVAPITQGEAPGSVFQYTWINGGALLTIGINQPITDGNGMNQIIGMIAEECKQISAGINPNELFQHEPMGMDRSLIREVRGTEFTRPEDHPSYDWLDTVPSHEEKDNQHQEPNISMFTIQITPSKLASLKAAANITNPRVSTHDAVCALIWRATMLSRYAAGIITNLDEQVHFFMPTDVRRLLGLPKDYIGRAVYHVTCKLPLRDLLDATSLPTVTSLIRSTLESRSKARVEGFYTLLHSLPGIRQISCACMKTKLTTAFVMGSSWRADQMYGSDWGGEFGPVIRLRSPDVGFFGSLKGQGMICPRVRGKGAAEVQMWVADEGWEALKRDEMFGRYCERICAPEDVASDVPGVDSAVDLQTEPGRREVPGRVDSHQSLDGSIK